MVAAMRCTWSAGSWAGRNGEDGLVAVRRDWPAYSEATIASTSPDGVASLTACCTPPPRHPTPSYCLFAVFDGHNGSRASRFAAEHLASVLEDFLPPWAPSPASPAEPAPELAGQLAEALVLATLELNRQFGMAGRRGGCTATLALQVGRLVTVASLGAGRCVLDTGCASEPVLLSVEHRIATNVAERQRLVAVGCEVADMDVGSCGPARHPGRGDGVLRLWPGGLSLSRSLGDFAVGAAVLPLPHIKQVLLPPSGGRLILATDGVWGFQGEALPLLHPSRITPVKTAAFKTIRAISTSRRSRVDASVIVADILPSALLSFASVCRRHEQLAAEAADAKQPQRRRLAATLQSVFGSRDRTAAGRSESDGPLVAVAAAPLTPEAPIVELLADWDSAALLRLTPWGATGELSVAPAARPYSRSSSASSTSEVVRTLMVGVREAQQRPAWFGRRAERLMWMLWSEAGRLWYLARCRERAIDAVSAQPAGATEGHVRSLNQRWLETEWLQSATAAATAAGAAAPAFAPEQATAGSPPSEAAPAAMPAGHVSPFASTTEVPGSAAPANASSGQVGAKRAIAAPPGRAASRTSSRSELGDTAGSDAGLLAAPSSARRVSFRTTLSQPLPTPRADPLATPRRRLPPLRTQSDCTGPVSPKALGSGRRASTPAGILHLSASGSARSLGSGAGIAVGSASPTAALSPRPSVEDRALRRLAPGELAASPGTKWMRAYSLVAGVFTKAGSGYSSRNMEAAAGVDTWTDSYGSMASQYMRRKGQA